MSAPAVRVAFLAAWWRCSTVTVCQCWGDGRRLDSALGKLNSCRVWFSAVRDEMCVCSHVCMCVCDDHSLILLEPDFSVAEEKEGRTQNCASVWKWDGCRATELITALASASAASCRYPFHVRAGAGVCQRGRYPFHVRAGAGVCQRGRSLVL